MKNLFLRASLLLALWCCTALAQAGTYVVLVGERYRGPELSAMLVDVQKATAELGVFQSLLMARGFLSTPTVTAYLNMGLVDDDPAARAREMLATSKAVHTALIAEQDVNVYGSVPFRAALGAHYNARFPASDAGTPSESLTLTEKVIWDLVKGTRNTLAAGHDYIYVAVGQGTLVLEAVDAVLRVRYPTLDISKLRIIRHRNLVPLGTSDRSATYPPEIPAVTLADDIWAKINLQSVIPNQELRTSGTPLTCAQAFSECLTPKYGEGIHTNLTHWLYFSRQPGSAPGGNLSMYQHLVNALAKAIDESVAISSVSAHPPTGAANQPVFFQHRFAENWQEGYVQSVTWTFSDNGTPLTNAGGQTSSRTFTNAGRYSATMTALLKGGGSRTQTISLPVVSNGAVVDRVLTGAPETNVNSLITVEGRFLPTTITAEIYEGGTCTPLERGVTSARFSCNFTKVGSGILFVLTDALAEGGMLLNRADFAVAAGPAVSTSFVIKGLTANRAGTISLQGTNLRNTIQVSLNGAGSCAYAQHTSTIADYTCTPTSSGLLPITVTASGAGSPVLLQSSVSVSEGAKVTSFSPLTAYNDLMATITVSGARFPLNSKLTLHGVTCNPSSLNAGSMVFTCFTGSTGTKNLVFTEADGTAVEGGSASFVVTPRPVRVVSEVTPRYAVAGTTARVEVSSNFFTTAEHLAISGQGNCTLVTVGSTKQGYDCVLTTAGTSTLTWSTTGPGYADYALIHSQDFTVSSVAGEVTSISPLGGTAGSTVNVVVNGASLPSTAAMTIANQGSCTAVSRTATRAEYTCGLTTGGLNEVRVLASPGGALLFNGSAAFQVQTLAPSVSGVSPLQGSVASTATVAVAGMRLTGAETMTIANQGSCTLTSNTSTFLSFQCALTTLGSHTVMVLRNSNDTAGLFTGTYTVAVPAVAVNSISPLLGWVGNTRSITVAGTQLPETLAMTVANQGSCTATSRSASSTVFDCAITTLGNHTVTVKASPTGNTLYNGTATMLVDEALANVTGITPPFGTANTLAQIRVLGFNLPVNMQLALTGQPACSPVTRTTEEGVFNCPLGAAGFTSVTLSFVNHRGQETPIFLDTSLANFSIF